MRLLKWESIQILKGRKVAIKVLGRRILHAQIRKTNDVALAFKHFFSHNHLRIIIAVTDQNRAETFSTETARGDRRQAIQFFVIPHSEITGGKACHCGMTGFAGEKIL